MIKEVINNLTSDSIERSMCVCFCLKLSSPPFSVHKGTEQVGKHRLQLQVTSPSGALKGLSFEVKGFVHTVHTTPEITEGNLDVYQESSSSHLVKSLYELVITL